MGMFDEIKLPCPNCGEIYYAQSKSGPCVMAIVGLDDTSEDAQDIIRDVNRHAPFRCHKCKTVFEVKLVPTIIKCPEGTKGKYES